MIQNLLWRFESHPSLLGIEPWLNVVLHKIMHILKRISIANLLRFLNFFFYRFFAPVACYGVNDEGGAVL